MLRRISKKLIGKRPATMRVTDYYNVVNHVERKIKAIIATVLGIVMIVAIICLTYDTDTGYYAPDYVDENGIIHDIDGDGYMYHWIEE